MNHLRYGGVAGAVMVGMHHLRYAAVPVALLFAFGLASCGGKSPSSPSPNPQSGTVAPVSLEIVAPASVPPGETAQLQGVVHKTDGSTQTVTGQVTWTSGNQAVLTVSGSGAITARDRGVATIFARYGGLSARADVLVLPAGTYRVTGTVREQGLAVENVDVTVVSAELGAGLSTRTVFNGGYSLYGVAGDAQIRFSKAGYSERIEKIGVGANQRLDVELAPSGPLPDVNGTYTLTFTVSQCQPSIYYHTDLPDEARQRVYEATITQTGRLLRVQLGGADLVKGAFNGQLDFGEMTFDLGDGYYVPYDVIERLGGDPPVYVAVGGSITVTLQGSTLAGTLNGAIAVARDPKGGDTIAYCYARDHNVTLRRR